MCLEGWKKHSSATGGYFRCNKLDSQSKVDERHDSKLAEVSRRRAGSHCPEMRRSGCDELHVPSLCWLGCVYSGGFVAWRD